MRNGEIDNKPIGANKPKRQSLSEDDKRVLRDYLAAKTTVIDADIVFLGDESNVDSHFSLGIGADKIFETPHHPIADLRATLLINGKSRFKLKNLISHAIKSIKSDNGHYIFSQPSPHTAKAGILMGEFNNYLDELGKANWNNLKREPAYEYLASLLEPYALLTVRGNRRELVDEGRIFVSDKKYTREEIIVRDTAKDPKTAFAKDLDSIVRKQLKHLPKHILFPKTRKVIVNATDTVEGIATGVYNNTPGLLRPAVGFLTGAVIGAARETSGAVMGR